MRFLKKIIIYPILLSILFSAPALLAKEQFQTIIVKKGETLTQISKKYLKDPRKWRQLLNYNKIPTPDLIYPGRKLNIPASLSKQSLGIVLFKINIARYSKKHKKKWMKAFPNQILYNGDSVRTGKRSKLKLAIHSEAVLVMQENTRLVLDANLSNKPSSTSIYLSRGRLYTNVSKIRKRSSLYKINTPAAIVAVRGTKFVSTVEENGNTSVGCHRGVVTVSAQGKTVVLRKGYGTYVKMGSPPEEPRKLPRIRRVDIKKGK